MMGWKVYNYCFQAFKMFPIMNWSWPWILLEYKEEGGRNKSATYQCRNFTFFLYMCQHIKEKIFVSRNYLMFLLDQTHNLSLLSFLLHWNKWLSSHLSVPLVVRLNHTITDDCKWTACLHPKDSASEVMSNNNDKQCNLEVQISNHFDVLKKEIMIKKVLAEDLQLLHNALVHLEAHPATGREVPNIDWVLHINIRNFLRYKSLNENSEDRFEELNANFGCKSLISDFDSI